MTAADELDPGAWRPHLRPRKRWERSDLYGTGISKKNNAAQYMAVREILGLPGGRRVKVSRDLMDRAEWVGVDPDACSAESSVHDVAGWVGLDAEEHADAVRFVAALDQLNERHRYVLVQRSRGETLGDVGAVLGLSRERVRQLELEAAHLVRRQLKMEEPPRKPSAYALAWATWHAECARWNAGG